MRSIKESLQIVKERIRKACERAGRKEEEITIVAVTKGVGVERILEAKQAGITNFGENYIQEAKKKIETIGDQNISWHMIGYIQTNKVKYLPKLFSFVHSVDRWEVVEGLEKTKRSIDVLFELNLSGEKTKHGMDEEGLKRILERIREVSYVKPCGLMTMAPFVNNPEEVRPIFRKLRKILEIMNKDFSLHMKDLSMGMSQDFEVAIEEGSTMIRIGRILFGERK